MTQRKKRMVVVKETSQTATLKDAQMAVYWPSSTHGVFGLATKGPGKGSRISPIVPQITVNGKTSIIDATPEATELWRKEPWN
jgi:hypothetical protein